MQRSEDFRLEIVQYPENGYCGVLESNVRRGVYVEQCRGFVNESGYRDIEIVPQLVSAISWKFGSHGGVFGGLAACTISDIEQVTSLVAFRHWNPWSDSALHAHVSFSDGIYTFRPKSKIHLFDLTEIGPVEYMVFLPRFPDVSLALKVEDGSTMFFVRDAKLETLPFLISYCENLGVPIVYSEPYEAELESMTQIDTLITSVVHSVKAEQGSPEELPLAKWYDGWLNRFVSPEKFRRAQSD